MVAQKRHLSSGAGENKNELKQKDGILTSLLFTLLKLFGIGRADLVKAKAKVDADLSPKIERSKQEVKDIKRDARIERKVDNAKKALRADKLKKDKLIYIKYPGEETMRKEVFLRYDEKYIYTNVDKHVYERVFSWRGRPVIKPE